MAANNVADMQRAQAAILQSGGFVVRNGFIDESPCAGAEGSRSRRHSAPPPRSPPPRSTSPRRFFGGTSASASASPAAAADSCTSSSSSWPGFDDDASTQASSPRHRRCSSTDSAWAEDGNRDGVVREGVEAEPEPAWSAAEELRQTILTKCAFLRFSGDTYKTFPSPSKSGCTGSFMFYVWGLPWARRARWVVPLRMSVAKVLECTGYRTQMCAGVLYVSDPAESFKIRISFAPSLAAAPAR